MTESRATPPDDAPRMIYVTCGSADEAARIARAVVGERLAACANIIEGTRSFYWWEGEVQDEPEVVLIMKTAAPRVVALTERIKGLHSYDVPCVVEIAIAGGNAAFLDWIIAETAER